MRRYFLILSLAVISLLFSQCRKEVITENGNSPVNGTFTLTANIDNGGSRTDITAAGQITWKSGDKIYIANSTGIVGSLSYSEGSNFTGNALVDGNYYFYYLGS